MEAADLAILGAVGLAYAIVSRRLGRTIVTSAMVFLTAGIVLGDAVLGWFTVGPSGATLRLIAESTLALVLFTDASRIDLRTLRRELAVPVRLLGIGLPLTIAAGVAAALLTPPGLTVRSKRSSARVTSSRAETTTGRRLVSGRLRPPTAVGWPHGGMAVMDMACEVGGAG
ncbi:MAG TPA: cation:proton antiporter [Candidatus Limnocylindria bacterium]|nr:cation:proton antiporter [Candidatus Limnocylindria bacterium]